MNPIHPTEYNVDDYYAETSFDGTGVIEQPAVIEDLHTTGGQRARLVNPDVNEFYESLKQKGLKATGINYDRLTTDRNEKLAIKVLDSKANKINTNKINLYRNKGRIAHSTIYQTMGGVNITIEALNIPDYKNTL